MTSGKSETTQMGQVKWFNNKSGFGFITVINGEHVGQDVFVHHSDLSVVEEQYRYLIAGEYVEFEMSELNNSDNKPDDTNHKFKAVKVKGICSGKLMCEVRRNMREDQPEHRNRQVNKPELNTSDERANKEWMVVRRRPTGRRAE